MSKKVVLTLSNSISKNSRPEVLCKNGTLKNFAKLTQAYHFIKKRTSIYFVKHLITTASVPFTCIFPQLRLHFFVTFS